MAKVFFDDGSEEFHEIINSEHVFDESMFRSSRPITDDEIAVLKKNGCRCTDWGKVFVHKLDFNPELICSVEFSGTVVLGRLRKAFLRHHDLTLECGIYDSMLRNCVIGDHCAIRNVRYLENYKIGDSVMLFNINEMSCTHHSKFGCGVLKKGENENVRVNIAVCNENEQRSVLAFESMITADAFLWSKYRDDTKLMDCFKAMTEAEHDPAIPTYGIVGSNAVIKNTLLIKDAKIGDFAYIKGALKLKNITILSNIDEVSQIGEGVEMVNGILGYGSKVFYQAVAVRFVIGRNCQLKYGARLINSVLGDNSTVSCCELLSNLIFPFHEQHHNSSFLIATTIMGQSNIAAGATIGSNHNSRSPDGEIIAGRGFWPGLCSDFKHSSRFASFCLISKGSYQNELNITYPFSLIRINNSTGELNITPAYWFLYNMFAIARNNSKFLKRDKRQKIVQHIETDPLAPDTIQEVLFSLDRIIELTARELHSPNLQAAKNFLHQNPDSSIVLEDPRTQRKSPGKILKAPLAYKEYRKITKFFAVRSLIRYYQNCGEKKFTAKVLDEMQKLPLYTEWLNVGGQIIPAKLIDKLFSDIKSGKIKRWNEVHAFYDECQKNYDNYKARYGIFLLETLYSKNIREFGTEIYNDVKIDVMTVCEEMFNTAFTSRKRDYDDFFRALPYRNNEEMTAVLGTVHENRFLTEYKIQLDEFKKTLCQFFAD
jgi:NDP-sugar pyrophosphorylase family protein